MDFTRRFKKNTDITFKEEGDGAFLFDPETGNLKYMNRSATETYLMLNGQKDFKQLAQHWVSWYPNEAPQQIQKDLDDFLKELQDNRFIFSIEDEELKRK
jgi:hypothetical protein